MKTPLLAALALLSTLTAAPAAAPSEKPMTFHALSAPDLEGNPVTFKDFAGKVALVVNVASECGYTPQYTGLQKLYEDNQARGLVVLGFPSNEFGGQEPGTEAEIATFCSTKFHVTFPMFSKVSVKPGDAQSPVYRFLTADKPAPKWNFTKYLVGKDGKVVASFAPDVAPESPELKQAIDAALAAK